MREPTKCPAELEYWTADEVAECIPGVGNDLYRKLWRALSEAKNPTPLGGDGSNGTVEYPDGRRSPDNDDKAPHWWGELTEEERQTIVEGAIKDGIIRSQSPGGGPRAHQEGTSER